jgi:hypothetical protein
VWAVLVVAAGGVMFLIGRDLWRKAVALFDELGTAADRLSVLDQELTTLAERTGPDEQLAIFADPATLRQAREKATRAARSGRQPRQPRHRAFVVRPTEPGRAAVR